MRWMYPAVALLVVAGIVKVTACGGNSLKRAGEACTASSECGQGLVCDFNREPRVCASMGVDAPIQSDAAIDTAVSDGSPDARPDAPLDAPLDAPPDAPDAM